MIPGSVSSYAKHAAEHVELPARLPSSSNLPMPLDISKAHLATSHQPRPGHQDCIRRPNCVDPCVLLVRTSASLHHGNSCERELRPGTELISSDHSSPGWRLDKPVE